MKRLACALAAWTVGILAPSLASAYDNDLRLHKLGAPETLSAGGQIAERDPFAQERFARFATELGLATTSGPTSLSATTGDAGFSIAFTPQVALIHRKQRFNDGVERLVWPTVKEDGGALFLPTLHLRKGLPFSLEVGTDVSWLSFSHLIAVGANVKWAIFEGFQWFPEIAVRGFVSTVLGTEEISVITGGWDIGASYRFPILGSAEGAVYGGYQRMGIDVSTRTIDFLPDVEDPADPFSDNATFSPLKFGSVFSPDTGFHRFYFGAQLRYELLVIGFDAVTASGTNRIGVGHAEEITTELFKLTGRLGVTF